MTTIVRITIPLFMLFSLVACGGGGGGSDPVAQTPSVSLTGTITDSTQAAVAGVQVAVTNAATGSSVASATTDVAGRYNLRGLPTGVPLRVSAAAGRGYFPMSAVVTLVGSGASLLDVALPSTRDKATKLIQFDTLADSAGTGGTLVSPTVIGGAETASLMVPAGSLQNSAAVMYGGAAKIYLAPLEVGKLGTGFAPYQVVLPAAVGDSYPGSFPGQILELYAAAAVDLVAANGSTLESDGSTVLTIPVPPSPAFLRTSAAAAAAPILWRFNPATSAWVETASVPTFDAGTSSFSASISKAGIYGVGVTSAATSISGRLLYNDGTTPAGGVMVYVTGVDAAYQQIVSSDSAGNFTALVKDASEARLDFISWGYGLQLSGSDRPSVDLSTESAVLGDLVLDYAKPAKDVSSAAIVRVDDSDVSQPTTSGIIFSSGRVFVATDNLGGTDTLATAEIADVVLVAQLWDFEASAGPVVNLEAGHSGTAGSSQLRLVGAPTYGNKVRLDDLDLTGAPANIEVLTADGHRGVLNVRAVDGVSNGPGYWTLTLSAGFSL